MSNARAGKKTERPSSGRRRQRNGVQPACPAPGPELFLNREWSWLDFNARVLDLAGTAAVPLLERVKFLSIASTNLDEFYMVRVAGLKEQLRTNTRDTGPDLALPEEQLAGIHRRVRDMVARQAQLWLNELQPALASEGIAIVKPDELRAAEAKYLRAYFQRQVFPVLTPMGVDPAHPFPHLRNRRFTLCVQLERAGAGNPSRTLYARIVRAGRRLRRSCRNRP